MCACVCVRERAQEECVCDCIWKHCLIYSIRRLGEKDSERKCVRKREREKETESFDIGDSYFSCYRCVWFFTINAREHTHTQTGRIFGDASVNITQWRRARDLTNWDFCRSQVRFRPKTHQLKSIWI